MTETLSQILPALALILLCGVHLQAYRLTFLAGLPRSRWLSAAGGISLAYVFLHFLPELAHGQSLVEGSALALSWIEFELFAVALTGLLGSYALERMVQLSDARDENADHQLRESEKLDESEHGVFWLHLASFGVYNFITGYLLLHRGGEDGSIGPLIAFTVAMALHLLVTDYGLREAFPQGYRRLGRWILIGALIAGFVLGLTVRLTELMVLSIVALLGGGMVLNVLKEELPTQRKSRFGAMLAGAIAYGAVLALME